MLTGFAYRDNKAVVYLRVSTEEQVDNYSLSTQQSICQKEAERRGLQIVKVFKEEGRSAKTILGRPILIDLLEYCRKNRREVSALIVYRLDRISRQISDYLSIRKKLAEYEVTLISASEPTGNSPTEKFIETMLAGFAQMDNDVRSERTKNGLKARFMTGLNAGIVPLGYLRENGYVIKDPLTWDKVKSAWDLMATGTKTLREMANYLNEQKIKKCYRGKVHLIRQQTVNRIFRNKFYVGKVVSNTYGLEVQGQHSPMINEEQFYRVQAILDGRNTNITVALARRNSDNPEFPLRRIVKCKNCGTSFTAAWSKGKLKRYAYYFCKKRCGYPSIPVSKVDEEMLLLLNKISLKPKTLDLLIAFLRKTYFERVSVLQKKRDQADLELKKLYELRQALIEKNLSGTYSDVVFKEQNKILEQKIKEIRITKDDTLTDKYNLGAITKFIKEKFENLAKTYLNSDLEQKRVLLCSIFPQGVAWSYPGYSNTTISPYYQAILDIQAASDTFCSGGGSRTHFWRL